MVRTIVSIFISAFLLVGICVVDVVNVNRTFTGLKERLIGLYEKTESREAAYTDGVAVRKYWTDKRKILHIWLPHNSIENVDYQLNEALGYLYEEKYEDALPKIEVLIEMTEKIPSSYSIKIENIF